MAFTSANQILEYLFKLSLSGDYVFRGYSIQEQMKPGLIRYGQNLADKEEDILRDFEYYGSGFYSINTPFDFLSTAQHFGLPTRLVDYTYNPFVALAFAINSPKKGNEQLSEGKNYDRNNYYIRICKTVFSPVLSSGIFDDVIENTSAFDKSFSYQCCEIIEALEKTQENCLTQLIINDLKKQGKDIDHIKAKSFSQKILSSEAMLLIDANRSNMRISNQEGLFMLPLSLDVNRYQNIVQKCTRVIAINKLFRDDLLKQLEKLGYTTYRLMPDLMSVCSTIANNYRFADQQATSAFGNSELGNGMRCISDLSSKELRIIVDYSNHNNQGYLPGSIRKKLESCGVLVNSKMNKQFSECIRSILESSKLSSAEGLARD